MSLRAKCQINSFVTYIVSNKKCKKNVFTSFYIRATPCDFSKILFYQVSHGTYLCVELHHRRRNILMREESHRNHRSRHIGASRTPLDDTDCFLKLSFQSNS